MRKKTGKALVAEAAPSGGQTPPDPNSKRSLKKAEAAAAEKQDKKAKAKAKAKAKGTKKKGEAGIAAGTLIQGGVVAMMAAGAQAMCERPPPIDVIISQIVAIPGYVAYASLLDSFVENGDYIHLLPACEDKTSLALQTIECEDKTSQNDYKSIACVEDTATPEPETCTELCVTGPCCFVGLDAGN